MGKYAFQHHKQAFRQGLKDGVPISLGYFAVSFSLGILAKKAGLLPIQGFLASLLCNASAGEYAAFTVIAENGTYLAIALATLVANARYFLMSAAFAQRLDPEMPFFHRFLLAFDMTDEIFGVSISKEGLLDPWYTYGAVIAALPGWSVGTMLGIIAGSFLPVRVVNALSVALYGMFFAVIIPPARKSKIIAGIILACFLLSFACTLIPYVKDLSEGTRTIILTVAIASAAALLFPREEETEAEAEA
ncbi:MAG: AzlC family ABC transporter permease [Clostridia bacterium]|nr:AzlC family ABC transporter permease [Clostridia bacterium]